MWISGVGKALPPYFYSQADLLHVLTQFWLRKHHNPNRVTQFHQSVQVNGRYFALPLEEYEKLDGFSAANQAFIKAGTQLAEEATIAALDQAGLKATDIDAIFFTTVTGLSVPTIDAKLINRLGFRPNVKRMPMFGLGCLAGTAGVARMYDYLQAYPSQTALLIAVELCSLTIQTEDLSIPNLIATGLFGDGAAAVVGEGNARPRRGHWPKVIGSESVFYPDTERTMGWDIGSHGFKIVLDAKVPQLTEANLGRNVHDFLGKLDLQSSEINHWICHPGGPKVLEAVQKTLHLQPEQLELTWKSLQQIGNLSSVSVLMILEEYLRTFPPEGVDHAVMLSMGPGFCSELVGLTW